MGATHLWEIVQPARQIRSLSQLTVSEGFEVNRNDHRTLVVGIDASIWLHQTQAIFHHARHSQAGENPELRILFYKLNRLLGQCLDVVVVFDGDERPSTKRGTRVHTQQHWLTKRFREFVKAHGFSDHMAPAEAEVELALLNRMGIIDVVMTDDSDALIFGAIYVMHNSNIKKDKDNITIYASEAIKSTAGVHLTQCGMLLIAILCGGDYDKAGLVGCGKVVAHGPAQTTLGDTLLEAGRDLSEGELATFLVQWRELLRDELSSNKHGFLKCRYPSLANAVHSDFPKPSVVLNYTQPITSWSQGRPLPPFSTWFGREIDLAELGALAEQSFSWSPDKIVEKFHKHIWAGVCLHRLLEEKSPLLALINHVEQGVIIDGLPGLSSFRRVHGVNRGSPTSTIPFYVVEVLEHNLVKKATSTLQSDADVPMARKTTVRIPASIVCHVLPDLRWEKPLPVDLQPKKWETIFKSTELWPPINFKEDMADATCPLSIPDHIIDLTVDDTDTPQVASSSKHNLQLPVGFRDYLDLTGDDAGTAFISSSGLFVDGVIDLTADD